jgi:colanic acid biosynthesis glycosyl transferase WcaI
MKILFETQYYPPESNAPANRVSEMARQWVREGHDVTVLTAFPHHPTGVIPAEYEGYRFLREERDGVHVVRTYIYVAPNKGILKRSLSYFSWMFSSMLLGGPRTPRPDVLVATSPQFLCALSGFFIARAKRVPFVLEIRDLWPDSILAVGALKEGFTISVLRALERFLYAVADAIVIVSPGFRPHMRALGIADEKVHLLPNGVDLDRFSPGSADCDVYAEHGIGGSFRVLYTGTVGMAHGLEIMLEAGEQLRDLPEVAMVVVGEGARRADLLQEVARRGLTNVHFVPMQPRETMTDWIRGASAVLVHLRKTALFEGVLPSKMFEYMGCGKAILMGVGGSAAEIVEEAECGFRFEPANAGELVQLIRRLMNERPELERRGASGRAYVERFYDREKLAAKYVTDILEPVVRKAGGTV